jgi:multiple sugar transport system permease protein
MKLGMDEPLKFLLSSKAAIPLIVVSMTWKGAGATVLIYLSHLQTTDSQQYEAAKIDGANPFQRILYVTLPHLAGIIRTLFVLQLISVFQVFYEPLVMTSGGPNNASVSLLHLSYRYAFEDNPEAGKSAAMGLVTAIIIIAFTAVYLLLTRPKKEAES